MDGRSSGAPTSASAAPRSVEADASTALAALTAQAVGTTKHPRNGANLTSLQQLQREAGNRAVAQLLTTIQRDFQLGDEPSSAIGHLQQQLNALGHATPRLPVTGRFDAAMEQAVKNFEKSQGLDPQTGIVTDELSAKLDTLAPLVSHGDQFTVEVGAGSSQNRLLPGPHPALLKQGSKGAAVMEVQERINNSATMTDDARKARKTATNKLSVDGDFGGRTHSAVQQFQRDNKLSADGRVGPITWGKLESAGAASQGRVEFEWREDVEGVGNVGLRAKYEWKLAPDQLLISSKVNFVPKAKGLDAKITEWMQQVKTVWNTFDAVNKKDPAKKIPVDFEIVKGAGEHVVNVFDDAERSDSSNWHAKDLDPGLAPHEFGHLIGLADEYNRDEGQFIATTGQEVPVGESFAGEQAEADAHATAIKGAMPLIDDGTTFATIIPDELGRSQGGYSAFVGQRYKALFGTEIVSDIKAAFVAKDPDFSGFHGPKSDAVTPFLYSTGGIMGMMTTLAPGEHDHPVEPRHIRPFTDIVTTESSLKLGAKDEWEPKRR